MSFEHFRRAYTGRHELTRVRAAAGMPIAGYYGTGFPIELALATGFLPCAIAPEPGADWRAAAPYVLETMPASIRTALADLVAGHMDFMDIAVFMSQAEETSLLYYCAKEVLRLGEGAKLPPLHLHVAMAAQHPAAHAYNHQQIIALAARLGATSGKQWTAAGLVEAAATMNQVRAVGRELQAARHAGLCNGTDAMVAIGAMSFLSPDVYLIALQTWLAGLGRVIEPKCPKVLLVSSEPLSDLTLHSAIEAAGALVVGEDDPWGSRAFGPDLVLGPDPLLDLSRYYGENAPSRAVSPHTRRHSWLYDNAIRPEVAAVIFHMSPADRSLGWDYPHLRKWLVGQDIPSLAVFADPFAPGGREQVTSSVGHFLSTLQAGGAHV